MFRVAPTLRPMLKSIVADRGRCTEAGFKVARFDQISIQLRMIPPHTGKAVCLQFHWDHTHFLPPETPDAAGGNFFSDAEQILHMMADLVRDDIGLSEIPGAPNRLASSLKNRIEIHSSIRWTIKGGPGHRPQTARRAD